MVKITPKATSSLHSLVAGKNCHLLRITLLTGGCGIRFFGVQNSAKRCNDREFEINGFTFLVENYIAEQYFPLTIDSDGFSFRISGMGISPPSACGTCSFGCSPQEDKLNCQGNCGRCSTPCTLGKKRLARRQNHYPTIAGQQ